MKKHFFVLAILLLFILNIRVYAEETPTITLNGVNDILSNDDNDNNELVEKDSDNYYSINGSYFQVLYGINNISSDYCLLRETYEVSGPELAEVNCDYAEDGMEEYMACDHCHLRYSIVKKSDYEEMSEEYEEVPMETLTTLKKYDSILVNLKSSYYENIKNLKASVDSVEDENGTTISKVSGKYIINKNIKNYNIKVRLSENIEGLNYNYFYNIYKLDKNGIELVNINRFDEVTLENNIITVPLDISEIAIDNFSFSIQIQAIDKNGLEKDVDTEMIEFEYEGKKKLNASFSYKNSDEAIEYKNDSYIIKSSNFNEENPLVINVELENFNNEINYGGLVFSECTPSGEDEICENEYEKDIELSNSGVNTIEINDFVPKLYSGQEKQYKISFIVGGKEYSYYYTYTAGSAYSLLMSSSRMFIPTTVVDKQNNNYKGYAYILDTDGYAYLFYKGANLENKTYKYKLENKTTKEVYSQRKINGVDLMLNTFIFKFKTSNIKNNKILFYLYDMDNNLLSSDELSIFDKSDMNLNENISVSGDGVDTKVIDTGYEIYVNKGNNNVKLRFSNSTYDLEEHFNYIVKSNEEILQEDYVTAQDIKSGITVNLNNITSDEEYYPITILIIGKDSTHEYDLSLKMVSNSEFNKIKEKPHFDLSTEAFNKVVNRLNDNELAFVNNNGDNVTKQITYTANYYKDGELLETNTINETIDYFDDTVEIDEEVADNSKYYGYRIKETSQTRLNSSTNEHYLEPIGDNGVLDIYYEVDPNQTKKVSYTVEYYKDDVLADTDTVTKSIQVLQNKLSVSKESINTETKYIGFKYLKSNYDEIPDEIEIDGVIKIYFEKKEIYYRYEYYFNGTLDSSLTKRIKGLYLETINTYEDHLRTGYKLGKVENYPLVVGKNGEREEDNIIKVQYVIDENNLQDVSVKNIKIKKGDKNSLILSWDKDEFAIGYKVLVSSSKTGKYKQIAVTTDNQYISSDLTYGKTYYYKVTAYNFAKTGTSSIVSKKVVPNEVTNFKITGASTGNIKLAWDKTSVTGYVLERSTGNGYWTRVATIKKATVTYKNTGLRANKKYYYRIRAYKSVNGKKVYSAYSDIVNTRTAPLKTKVKVTLKDYNALKVKVTSVKGAKTYDIYRSTSKNGKYEKIIELKEAGTYKDPELVTGKTYYYKVKTCNSLDRCSGYTSPVGLKVVPKTPSIKVKSTQTKKVSVTLTPVNGIDGLRIYRATSRYGKYKLIKDVKIDEDLTFNDKTKKYKYYYYKVRAYKIVDGKKVYSSYSTIKYVRSK